MNKPWLLQYDKGMKESLEYPNKSLYEMLVRTAQSFPHTVALSFEGTQMTFRHLLFEVDSIAMALKDMGLGTEDVATICLPNIPQAVIFFYAVNKLGIIANMVHPKTPPLELKEFMTSTKSTHLIILDAFLNKNVAMLKTIPLEHVFVASIGDYLSNVKALAFYLTKGRKIPPIPTDSKYLPWKDMKKRGLTVHYATGSLAENHIYKSPLLPTEPAVYLHSGGTTGSPKTIVLSSANLNVLAVAGPQIVNIPNPFESGQSPQVSMVTILPLFHGFGLCMGMHTMISNGITAILVPQFEPNSLAKIILKERPTFIAAVPTLYEGLLKSTVLQDAKLPFLKCCFCGGDSLSPDLKARFDTFLKERGADISLREGYGLTETVTVCCVNPEQNCRSGSVGLPLPDIDMKIIEADSEREVPIGTQGEICVSGPTTMLKYLDDPQATQEAIHLHQDGRYWVHTGDYGYMDQDGFFYFTQRLKRIIKVSGIPVFPSQIEALISQVEGVASVCAIGVSDPYRMHVIKAFVIATPDFKDESSKRQLAEAIKQYCASRLIPHACPATIEFRDKLPLTLVGKIDYKTLEKEEEIV